MDTLTARERKLIRRVVKALRAEFDVELREAVRQEHEKTIYGLKSLATLNGSGHDVLRLLKSSGFDESKHPRDHGKFSEKPGADGGEDKPEWHGDLMHDDHPARRIVPHRPQTDEEIEQVRQFQDDTGKVVESWVKDGAGHLPPDQQQVYVDNLKKTFSNMPVPIAQKILNRVGDVEFFADTAQLTEKMRSKGVKLAEGKRIGGTWETNPTDSVGKLYLDGGSDTDSSYGGSEARGVYAHELGHALDFMGTYSNQPEWWKAWSDEVEVEGDPLSKYARTNPSEGFAEYHRLMNTAPKIARTEYPKCWAFMKSKGLV